MTPFRRVAMLGIGLINGSLAKVIRREGLAAEIVAAARREETRARALELVEDVLLRQRRLRGVRGVERADDGLLDLGAGESLAGAGQRRELEVLPFDLPPHEVQPEALRARRRVGQSTKKISSKRPLRSSSAGRSRTWFAVATRNTFALRSAIHVSRYPSTRRDTPSSESEVAIPFSISWMETTDRNNLPSPSMRSSQPRKPADASDFDGASMETTLVSRRKPLKARHPAMVCGCAGTLRLGTS